MKDLNLDDSIARQYRRVWNKFHKIKKSTYDKLAKTKR